MLKLPERGSRYEPPDFADRPVAANTSGFGRQTQPEFPAGLLYRFRQSAIVDQLSTNGGDAADACESGPAHQNAAARGACGRALRVRGPCRRVEHEKEKHKSGNQ